MPNVWKNPELVIEEAVAKEKAWKNFLNNFPKADKSRFVSQENIDEKNHATAEVFFKEGEDSFQSVFGSDRKYWSAEMKEALGLGDSGGFSLPAGATWFKSFPAHPCGTFRRQSAKLEKNVQRRNQNLRHA